MAGTVLLSTELRKSLDFNSFQAVRLDSVSLLCAEAGDPGKLAQRMLIGGGMVPPFCVEHKGRRRGDFP